MRDTSDLTKLSIPAASKDDHISAVHWINENRIGFTVKNSRIEFEGGWDEYAADRDGANLTHLISGSWNHMQQNTGSHITDKVLTADYAYFGSLHDGSDDILVEKFKFNNIDLYAESSYLFRLNTRTRKLSELQIGKVPANVTEWLLDVDSVPRIAMSHSLGKCITSYHAPESADWTEISNADCYKDTKFSPNFFDGRDTLYVTATYKGNNALFKYDIKNKKMASEPFISIDGFDFNGSAEIDLTANKILGIHFRSDAISTVWIDPHVKDMQKKVDGILTQTINTITCGLDCLTAPVVLVTAESDRQPRQYFVYTPASGAIVGLGSTYPDIKPAQMGTRDFYHYAARDGMSIPVYVTLPPGKASAPMPTVVLVHGGPNARGSSWEWENEAQFLASRGYVVIQPEFRGSTGFGAAHFEAGWKQWGRAMQDDLADAAQWAIQKHWSDPKRIAIMGASYGGYATLMGLIKNPEIFRCGVEWAGVTDLGMRFTTPESDASQEVLQYSLKTLMGDPVADAAMFKENSPLVNAAKLTQPLLIAHGALDLRVPIVHATAFRDAVGKTNPHVEWIVYSDEAHGWRHEKNNIDFWKHVEVFLDKNLKTTE